MSTQVDASSVEDFDRKLEALEDPWNTQESPHSGQAGPRFYDYFKHVQANVVRHDMREDLREAIGQGLHPFSQRIALNLSIQCLRNKLQQNSVARICATNVDAC